MLAVKHIIDAVAAADFDRIDLVQVKMFRRPFHMPGGQIPLVFLVGNEVLNGD